jgi:hypothetical protein
MKEPGPVTSGFLPFSGGLYTFLQQLYSDNSSWRRVPGPQNKSRSRPSPGKDRVPVRQGYQVKETFDFFFRRRDKADEQDNIYRPPKMSIKHWTSMKQYLTFLIVKHSSSPVNAFFLGQPHSLSAAGTAFQVCGLIPGV